MTAALACVVLLAGAMYATALVARRGPTARRAARAAPVPAAVRAAASGPGPVSGPGPGLAVGPTGDGGPPSIGPAPPTAPAPMRPTPPTQLPPPGAQQPADPGAARQALSAVVERAWGPGETDAEHFANFDDAHGFDQAERELRSGSDANEANSAITTTVDEVVFLSATQAAFQFRFHIAGFGTFAGFFGEANLVNGTWTLTRSTFCDALVTTNARCPA